MVSSQFENVFVFPADVAINRGQKRNEIYIEYRE